MNSTEKHHTTRRRSLRVAGAIIVGAATVALIPALPAVSQDSPPVGEQSPPRMAVCHNPGRPGQKTLILPAPAVEAHLRHGDLPGPCPTP